MAQFTQMKTIIVNPDIEIGQKELNKVLRDMELIDKFQVLNIQSNGNLFYITYHLTQETEEIVKKEIENATEEFNQ